MVSPAISKVSNLATQERTMSAPIPEEQPDGITPFVSGVMPSFLARERSTTELDAPLSTIARAALPLTLRRSEEHTSELQSRLHLVCRLLLEKKKKNNTRHPQRDTLQNAHRIKIAP